MFFRRNSKPKLEKALKISPVVLLTGARQTGKTTLMNEVAQDRGYFSASFDDLSILSAAKADPMGFVARLPKPVILDEVQRVPELFLAIKYDVDQHREPGRFALTGSTNPLLIPKLGDSLAGRMIILTLLPLSQGELLGRKEVFIDRLFKGEVPYKADNLSRQELYERILKGGYPAVQAFGEEERRLWFNSYITALLQKDVQDLAHVTALAEFPRILQLLATRAANLLNVAELSRAVGIPNTTLHRYLSLLEALFIVCLLQPWSVNIGKRLVKSSKLYLIDSGILAYLLGIDTERAAIDGKLMGSIVENFVVMELKKQASWSTTQVQLFHFRTQTGVEVDLVLEDAAGRIIGIEIKSSSTVTQQDFKGLRYLQESAQERFMAGIVLYTGSQSIPFGGNFYALPITSLWAE